MKYITKYYALNLNCSLKTNGDWHQSALDWNLDKIQWKESKESVLNEWGIEKTNTIPSHQGEFYFANTLRACADLIEEAANLAIKENGYKPFKCLKLMYDEWIGTPQYNEEFFNNIILFKEHPAWNYIEYFINSEFRIEWINFAKKNGINYYMGNSNINSEFIDLVKNEKNADVRNKILKNRLNEIAWSHELQDLYDICHMYENSNLITQENINLLSQVVHYKLDDWAEYLIKRTPNCLDKQYVQIYQKMCGY